MNKKTLITAGIQMAPGNDEDKNLAKAASLIELASAEGAKIICLPQLFNSRWFAYQISQRNFKLAQNGEGKAITAMKEAAVKSKAVIIAPIFESDGDDFYNTAFVISPDGGIIGKYRKMHVPQIPLWEERAYFKPGDMGFPVIKTPYANIGIQICWDIFFPEGMRILALKGAQIVFAPTASAFFHSHKKWEQAVCAASHANSIYIFRVNRVGAEEKQEFYGRSFCAGPTGDFLHNPSGSSEGIVLANIDLDELSLVRNEWVFLKDRRPGQYNEINGDER